MRTEGDDWQSNNNNCFLKTRSA